MDSKQMNHGTEFKGWNGVRPPCGLTGKRIQDGDYVVWFPHFIRDKEDPFWQYNEWPMLREAFDEWEHKKAFLARWREFVLTHVASRVHVLINQVDYLVRLAEPPPTIVLSFFAHGFGLSIPRKKWGLFRDLLLATPQCPREFRLPDNWRISVRAEGDRIRIAKEPPLTFREGKGDRIFLDQSEWQTLKNVLREIDRLLPQMSE